MPVTWSDEKLILLYCPRRGSNSRPSAHHSFKHGQGVHALTHSATAAVDINNIEMVQRRGARFVKHRYHNRSSVTDLLEDLKWISLETRRKESRLTMMYKIVNKQVAIDPDKTPNETSKTISLS